MRDIKLSESCADKRASPEADFALVARQFWIGLRLRPRTLDTEAATVSTENVIRIMCPNLACKRVLAVPGHARGKLVRCRSCGINIRIPVLKTKDEPATGQPAPPAAEDAA